MLLRQEKDANEFNTCAAEVRGWYWQTTHMSLGQGDGANKHNTCATKARRQHCIEEDWKGHKPKRGECSPVPGIWQASNVETDKGDVPI
jgi:hypothetical protein